MGREVARKIARSPNSIHALVKRNQTGSMSTTQVTQTTLTNSVTVNSTQTVTTRLTNPDMVAFTSVSATLTTAGSAASLTFSRNGSQVTQKTTGTTGGTLNITQTNTHTTPLQGPTLTIRGKVTGGSANLSVSVTREQQWV